MPPRSIQLLVVAPLILGATLGTSGCGGAGRFLGELFRERPPSPLDSMSVASDVRVDSLGYMVGSFVGEGTSRAVHLLRATPPSSPDWCAVIGETSFSRTSPGDRSRARVWLR
jgi:hypothetical protein